MPTSAHFIYIPGILILGTVLGFILGSRSARDAYRMEQLNAEKRAQKKADRAAAAAQSKETKETTTAKE